jgi:hypothetical protein
VNLLEIIVTLTKQTPNEFLIDSKQAILATNRQTPVAAQIALANHRNWLFFMRLASKQEPDVVGLAGQIENGRFLSR